MPRYRLIQEKIRALLSFVHMTTYNIINFKFPRVLIVHFYRLLRFHTQRHFRASLSLRVFNSCHPVNYSRQFFTNNPGHKIYRCMSARSTRHHTFIHNPTILHTKTFFAPQSSLIHPHSPHTSSSTSNEIKTQIRCETFSFFFL